MLGSPEDSSYEGGRDAFDAVKNDCLKPERNGSAVICGTWSLDRDNGSAITRANYVHENITSQNDTFDEGNADIDIPLRENYPKQDEIIDANLTSNEDNETDSPVGPKNASIFAIRQICSRKIEKV